MSGIKMSVLRGMAAAFASVVIMSAAVGALSLFINISDEIIDLISSVILAASAYVSAYTATQIHRSKGLMQGLLCGAGAFLAALLCSIVFGEFCFRDIAVVKAVACITAGAVGGIKGVNTKKTGLRH